MKANGYYEVSDVPALLNRGDVQGLLSARGALLDAAEQIVKDREGSGRAMTTEDRANIDAYMAQISDISDELAVYKRELIANNDSGLPVILSF